MWETDLTSLQCWPSVGRQKKLGPPVLHSAPTEYPSLSDSKAEAKPLVINSTRPDFKGVTGQVWAWRDSQQRISSHVTVICSHRDQ